MAEVKASVRSPWLADELLLGSVTTVPVAVPEDVNSTIETGAAELPVMVVPFPDWFTTILPAVKVVPAKDIPPGMRRDRARDAILKFNEGLAGGRGWHLGVMEGA